MVEINKSGVLAGQTAIITGASRGIGEAIAYRYAQEGANVVVSARTLEDGDHVLPGGINAVVKNIVDADGSAHAAIHPDKDAGNRGGTVYGMCKAALERFTTGLAAEAYDQHLGVNVISPGLVATPGVMHHQLVTNPRPKPPLGSAVAHLF